MINSVQKWAILTTIVGFAAFSLLSCHYSSEKSISLSQSNIYKLDFQSLINEIKNKYNIKETLRITQLWINYKPDGTISFLQLQFIGQSENEYFLIDVNYDDLYKTCKLQFSQNEKWPQFSYLYDEAQFLDFVRRISFDKLKPKIDTPDYCSYTVQYAGGGQAAPTSMFDVYVVEKTKVRKLKMGDPPAEGFLLTVYGNRFVKYSDHTSEESQSSNIYIFE